MSKQKVFIHTNNKQGLGAVLSKFSFERTLKGGNIEIDFINVDKLDTFKKFAGETYLRAGSERIYDPSDLQSFTLSRFMPPELMSYEGRALVVDPDIFAIQDISELFTIDLKAKNIFVCKKKDAWDTSMMLMDCSKLKHWSMEKILSDLTQKKIDYANLMTLKLEDQSAILDAPRTYNNLDKLTPDTKMIHMTNRLTQPWKTGLPIDFTRNPMPKILGIIPREPVHKLLGKYPTHYQKHPDSRIESFFIELARDAYKTGVLNDDIINKEVRDKHVRPDLIDLVKG